MELREKPGDLPERVEPQREPPRRERRRSAGKLGRGGGLETLLGAVAAVLAIVGLTGVLPFYMVTLAAIAIGGGLLIEGWAVSAAYARLAREDAGAGRGNILGTSGLGAQALGGAAAIVLGVLALFNFVPGILLPAAAITAGAALLFGGGARSALNWSVLEGVDARFHQGAAQAMKGASGATGIAGAGAVTLGVLSLLGLGDRLLLMLVSFLLIGAAMFLAGSTIAVRVPRMARRQEA